MNGPDSCAGQGRDDQFGRHGHVNTDPIPFFNPFLLKHIGEPANIFMQLPVGNGAPKTVGMVGFKNKSSFVADCIQMAVEGILRNIQLAAFKPFDVPVFKSAGVDLVPALSPVKGAGFMLPEFQPILLTLIINFPILFK